MSLLIRKLFIRLSQVFVSKRSYLTTNSFDPRHFH